MRLGPLARLAAAAALLAVMVAAYWPALSGGFIWDDELLVTKNAVIHASDGLYRMWFTTQAIDYWPVTNTTFWIDWRLWALNPVGYHVTNLLLHFSNAMLAWAVLRRLRIPGAFLAAVIFALHPVNVESVAWIMQRKNTLSLFFFLLSVLGYLKADPGAPRATRWYWWSVAAFVLSMLSKGSVASLPFVLLLITWWQRDALTRRDLIRISPFVAVAVGLTLVNVWFQTHGSGNVIRHATVLERVLGAAAAVWFYLGKAVLPINLRFVYPQWDVRADDVMWWIPLVSAAAVTCLLVWQRRHRAVRALLFTWIFVLLALLPVMGFADVYFMKYSLVADHYQYIALLGVCALIAAGIDRGLARLSAA